MTFLLDLAPIALAFFVVAVSPGPANIAVATIAMRMGRGAAMRFGMGLGVGLAIWGGVAATGMGAILQSSVVLLTALKVFGGLYLLWLAWQSWRSAMTPQSQELAAAAQGRWFIKGLILNLSNPKAVVAWMAALSMGMGAEDTMSGLLAATLVCMTLGFLNYAAHALAFSWAGFMRGYQRARRWIDGAVAALLAAAGLGLLRSALARAP
ncbi:threonine/homoserine/homoserine lactone efflux protein [Yoonia maricola]|uniref:Threonine/homoserine/homoserine lactone efflux protein n=1 Tax=Yoonia maricola TaxID=420999 RepID=A0A2M8W2N5_9RHOB|nr:LysE family transporter [Yoonia maricola]PJI85170.1 threonine/homoserine/homoserine lactone efflux protein [Yoonia maricola]